MSDPTAREAIADAMGAINRAWLDGRPEELTPLFHPGLVMVLPGFEGRVEGREAVIEGFVDFCTHATVREYREDDLRIDLVGETAVASFRFEMIYERSGASYRACGRDLWVFAHQAGVWLAVWRTMLDPIEEPA
jgi:hypothetical protein